MSVSGHLAVSPAEYDARIRSLIPLYDELIAEVARALGHAARPVRTVIDLGIGTGALARACLDRAPGTRVWGIDADPDMMAIARTRLGRLLPRVTMTRGSFLDQALPLADEIRLLERAGFAVDVPWRRSPFAVIVGSRPA